MVEKSIPRRTSSNIVAGDSRIVMSCLSPAGTFRTPPPPSFKPPRWTPNKRSSSESPRGTPSDGGARVPADPVYVQRERNVVQTHTQGSHSDSDTSSAHQGRQRRESPHRRGVSPSSPTAKQVHQKEVPGRPTANDICSDPKPVRRGNREVSTRDAGCPSNPTQQLQQQTYTFYNSDEEDTGSSDDSSENCEEEIEDVGDQGDAEATDLVSEHGPGETDAEKRRHRRYGKKAREREGDRRRGKGKPRNYLLVDQFTGRPYGPGVTDWRKEVILMSKKLDPAIGHINKQPMEAVKEISEWIRQSWEYSFLMRFEVVKDVVARGVTLRRAEIWKKIRNREPKPEDVTYRAWRSLRKEMRSPATIRKSMMCSKANASRINFGRTGPSGEVGVRERLRRQLRRSPDPDEIRLEMSRDKGYGGRSKRKLMEASIMHDREESSPIPPEMERIIDGNDSEDFDDREDAIGGSPKSASSLPTQHEVGRAEPSASAG